MRAAFESKWPVPQNCIWTGHGYAVEKYNAWDAQRYCDKWEGWQAASAVQAAEIARLTSELDRVKAALVVEQDPVRTKLAPMEDEEGKVWQWYFDCTGHYIDVVLDDNGKYSVFFRDRVTRGEAWLDQADEPAIANPQPSADAARDAELAALLPGTHYMDEPDGGSASVLEQVKRMAEDAARWRFSAASCVTDSPEETIMAEIGNAWPDEDDTPPEEK